MQTVLKWKSRDYQRMEIWATTSAGGLGIHIPQTTVFENQTKMSYFKAWRQCLSLILKVIWIFTQKIDFLINQHSINIFLARKFKQLKNNIISFKMFGVRIQRDIFYNFKHNERTLSKSANNVMLKKEFIKTRHCSSKRTHIVSRFRFFSDIMFTFWMYEILILENKIQKNFLCVAVFYYYFFLTKTREMLSVKILSLLKIVL